MLEMTPVVSRSVAEIGYDPVTRDLHVRFHSASTYYIYRGVPPDVFQRLLAAASKGSFVNTEIKTSYAVEVAESSTHTSARVTR